MWRPITEALDRVVSWKLRRSHFSQRSHRTDPEMLEMMVRELQPGDAAALFPQPMGISDKEIIIEVDRKQWGGYHMGG